MWLDCIIKWGHFLSHRINKTYRSIIIYKLLLVLVVNHIEKKQFLEKRKFKVMFKHFGRSSPNPLPKNYGPVLNGIKCIFIVY